MLGKFPIWLPVLLSVLIVLGYRQSRSRLIRPGALGVVALLMIGLSLWGVWHTFAGQPIALLAWASGMAGALALGGRFFGLHYMQQQQDKVSVNGSWWPLGLMLTIFAVKFCLGFAAAVHAAWLSSSLLIALCSLLLGLCSGGFVARAWRLHRTLRAGLLTQMPAKSLELPA